MDPKGGLKYKIAYCEGKRYFKVSKIHSWCNTGLLPKTGNLKHIFYPIYTLGAYKDQKEHKIGPKHKIALKPNGISKYPKCIVE